MRELLCMELSPRASLRAYMIVVSYHAYHSGRAPVCTRCALQFALDFILINYLILARSPRTWGSHIAQGYAAVLALLHDYCGAPAAAARIQRCGLRATFPQARLMRAWLRVGRVAALSKLADALAPFLVHRERRADLPRAAGCVSHLCSAGALRDYASRSHCHAQHQLAHGACTCDVQKHLDSRRLPRCSSIHGIG